MLIIASLIATLSGFFSNNLPDYAAAAEYISQHNNVATVFRGKERDELENMVEDLVAHANAIDEGNNLLIPKYDYLLEQLVTALALARLNCPQP